MQEFPEFYFRAEKLNWGSVHTMLRALGNKLDDRYLSPPTVPVRYKYLRVTQEGVLSNFNPRQNSRDIPEIPISTLKEIFNL